MDNSEIHVCPLDLSLGHQTAHVPSPLGIPLHPYQASASPPDPKCPCVGKEHACLVTKPLTVCLAPPFPVRALSAISSYLGTFTPSGCCLW